jgi:RNA polymerase sigma-70 factor (ECF subfamily)
MDEQLLQRIMMKERAALELLYNRYERLLYHTAYRATLDETTAESIVKELFSELWTYPYSYHRTEKIRFSAWFLQKCIEKCTHHRAPVPSTVFAARV